MRLRDTGGMERPRSSNGMTRRRAGSGPQRRHESSERAKRIMKNSLSSSGLPRAAARAAAADDSFGELEAALAQEAAPASSHASDARSSARPGQQWGRFLVRDPILREWCSTYRGEKGRYSSDALHAEAALNEARSRMTLQGDARPNRMCTSVAIERLAQLLGALPRFASLGNEIMDELLASVYQEAPADEEPAAGPPPPSAAASSVEARSAQMAQQCQALALHRRRPYFELAAQLKTKCAELQQQLDLKSSGVMLGDVEAKRNDAIGFQSQRAQRSLVRVYFKAWIFSNDLERREHAADTKLGELTLEVRNLKQIIEAAGIAVPGAAGGQARCTVEGDLLAAGRVRSNIYAKSSCAHSTRASRLPS